MDIQETLTRHHRTLDRLLEEWMQSPPDSREGRDTHFIPQLLLHIEIEEDCIFPLYATQFSDVTSVTPILIRQHEKMKSYLDALNSNQAGAHQQISSTLRKLIAVHNATEEYTVYPWVENIIRAADPAKLLTIQKHLESLRLNNRCE